MTKKSNVEKYYTATVESISFGIARKVLQLSLTGFNYMVFVDPNELHSGGKNCEIPKLCEGSKLKFKYTGGAIRELHDVTVMSDDITEVDDEGNLIRW